jgi:hypothetical protein
VLAIIEEAGSASTSTSIIIQAYNIIRITNQANREQLAELTGSQK